MSIRSRQTFDKIGCVFGRVYAVCGLHNCIKRDAGVDGSGGVRLYAEGLLAGQWKDLGHTDFALGVRIVRKNCRCWCLSRR